MEEEEEESIAGGGTDGTETDISTTNISFRRSSTDIVQPNH